MKKIALLGRSGAGKDTFADFLVEERNFTKLFFAEPLYLIANEVFGMKKKNRELLQDIGIALRGVDEEFLVNNLKKRVEEAEKEGVENIIITDVRQENEFNALKEMGFVFIYIDADLDKRMERIAIRDGIVIDDEYIKRVETNPAETGCDGLLNDSSLIAMHISNNRSLESLKEDVLVIDDNYELLEKASGKKGEKFIVIKDTDGRPIWSNTLTPINIYKSQKLIEILREKDNKNYSRDIETVYTEKKEKKEKQGSLMGEIPLHKRLKIIVEQGCEPFDKEVVIYLADSNGDFVQDLARVSPSYYVDDEKVFYSAGMMNIRVWSDSDSDDYTLSFPVDVRKTTEWKRRSYGVFFYLLKILLNSSSKSSLNWESFSN